MFLKWMLDKFVRIGTLTVQWSNGRVTRHGGFVDGPNVTIRFHDRAFEHALFINPDMALGEGYMDGRLTVEDGSLFDFMDLVGRNYGHHDNGLGNILHAMLDWAERMFRHLHQFNPVGKARDNVSHHYDLSGELYDLFLDSDRQYSCAYYTNDSDTLEQAQWNKKRHIAAKMLVNQGDTVLDIGSGWGGMGLFLARECGCRVTGVTLSEEQLAISRLRAKQEGLSDSVEFHLRDYRHQQGQFNRIVSIGMFEHVGVGHYREYFEKAHQLLDEDGVMLLHTIGRTKPPSVTSGWIRKYIFPGGYCPSLSEMIKVVERSGLVLTDVEVLRLHYAKTLRHWREAFMRHRDKAVALYDERFARMWEYYLVASEVAFLHMGHVVFQLQLTKKQDAVPLTRNYIGDWENRFPSPNPSHNAAAVEG